MTDNASTKANNGKVVWITGASMGIGRALALELATKGMTVIASARNQEKLQSLVERITKSLTGSILLLPSRCYRSACRSKYRKSH